MRTVYVKRSTEDLDEDMRAVRKDVDIFLDGTGNLQENGLGSLTDMLGV